MTDSTQIALAAPPVMGLIVFVVGWNIERTSAGSVSMSRAKALTTYAIIITLICYLIIWWNEIRTVWTLHPLLISLAGLGVVGSLLCVIWIVYSRSSIEHVSDSYDKSELQVSKRDAARRIVAWVVILWGIAGLLGGLVAIVTQSMKY